MLFITENIDKQIINLILVHRFTNYIPVKFAKFINSSD